LIRLCANPSYDDYINLQHLNEVLGYIISNITDTQAYKENILYLSIYLLFNLNEYQSTSLILNLPKDIRFVIQFLSENKLN
jgi:hypothetical protein